MCETGSYRNKKIRPDYSYDDAEEVVCTPTTRGKQKTGTKGAKPVSNNSEIPSCKDGKGGLSCMYFKHSRMSNGHWFECAGNAECIAAQLGKTTGKQVSTGCDGSTSTSPGGTQPVNDLPLMTSKLDVVQSSERTVSSTSSRTSAVPDTTGTTTPAATTTTTLKPVATPPEKSVPAGLSTYLMCIEPLILFESGKTI